MRHYYNLGSRKLHLNTNNTIVEASEDRRIAVVIPCYRVTRHILHVISMIGPEVWRIYVVDDACPESSGRLVEQNCNDPRVSVFYHPENHMGF